MTDPKNDAAQNTDREIWRAVPGDFYSDSIHVTEDGGIGINVGGLVIVKTPEAWHAAALADTDPAPSCGNGLCRVKSGKTEHDTRCPEYGPGWC